ncbi:ankyrin [Dendrothele bispora CBS 962.96]|uniref:Ankyrin n=1 Tax=Dendrothele bispora (strain CBS 962.96) TaxID=1314807 RepID=A0A4V4HIG0_DENBC|nr:ankyrin [Dendrothele bispora CBS 962.96]
MGVGEDSHSVIKGQQPVLSDAMPSPPLALFSPFLNYYDQSDSMVDIWRGTGLTGDAYFAARNDSRPLIVAAQSDNLPLVEQLISQNRSLLDQKGLEGETALHMAAALGHLTIVKELIEAEASVDALDEEGSTPLIHAIRFCPPDAAEEIVTALLSAGANPTQMVTVDISQHPPLWFAIKAHKLSLIRLLEPLTSRDLDVYPPGSATSRNHILDAAIIDADSYDDASILDFLIQKRSLPLRATDIAKASKRQTQLVLAQHVVRNQY